MKRLKTRLLPLTLFSLSLCISLLLSFWLFQKVGFKVRIMIAPLIVAAGITAAGSALGAGGSAIAQGKMNKKTRQFSERMYGVQRKDALADWEMQNEYNSPEMQMQRLRDAGLNPNLVYDNGASFGSPDAVRSSSAPSWNPQTPDYSAAGQSLGNSLASYVDMKAKTAQTDNVKAQNDLLKEQVKAADLENVMKASTYLQEIAAKNATNRGIADTAVSIAAKKLYNVAAEGDVLDAQAKYYDQQSITSAKQGTLIDQHVSTESLKRRIMSDENERAWIMNSTNVKEAAARISAIAIQNARTDQERKAIIQRMEGQGYENLIKELDAYYYKNRGVRSGDGVLGGAYRQGSEILGKLTDYLKGY